MKNKQWLITAIVLCGLAVMLGAFGAHGLKRLVSPIQIETFKTGVQYQFYHALAIALTVLISQFIDNQHLIRVMRLFFVGILCFSGSLYAFTAFEAVGTIGLSGLGLLTPLGGLFFLIGWFRLAWIVYKTA